METAVNNFEKAISKANSRLDEVSWKLDLFERVVVDDALNAQVSVIGLVDKIMRIKEEYEQLKRELTELNKLQTEVRQSLHYKSLQIQERQNDLSSRISR